MVNAETQNYPQISISPNFYDYSIATKSLELVNLTNCTHLQIILVTLHSIWLQFTRLATLSS